MTTTPFDDEASTRGRTLDPERYRRVRALFEGALEQPPAARAAYVGEDARIVSIELRHR
jgi:hypothetical protein